MFLTVGSDRGIPLSLLVSKTLVLDLEEVDAHPIAYHQNTSGRSKGVGRVLLGEK